MSVSGYNIVNILNGQLSNIKLVTTKSLLDISAAIFDKIGKLPDTEDTREILEVFSTLVASARYENIIDETTYKEIFKKITYSRKILLWEASEYEDFFGMALKVISERGTTMDYTDCYFAKADPERLIAYYRFITSLLDDFKNPRIVSEYMRITGKLMVGAIELEDETASKNAHKYLNLALELGYCTKETLQEYKVKCIAATRKEENYLETHEFE